MRARAIELAPRSAVSILLLLGFAGAAHANGFRNPPEGAGPLGRTGGKIALTQDASAISHNSANLADMEHPQLVQSAFIIYGKTDYSGVSGNGSTKDPWKFLPSVFYATPLKDRLAVGVGLTTPFGQSTEWYKDGPFAFTAPYFAELITVNVRPVVSYRVNDQLAVGVGMDVMYSKLRLKQQFPWGAVTGNPMEQPGNARFDGDDVGVGGNAAVTWTPVKGHTLAATYRSRTEIEYEGDFDVSRMPPPSLLPGPLGMILSPSSSFDSKITFPSVVGLGYGVDLSERLHVGVDVEWIEFSTFDELPLDIGNNAPLLPTSSVPQDWDDTWTAGLGVEFDATETFTLRCGYVYLESPIPEETVAPTLPDSDRHLLSAGVGYETGPNTFDVAYAYSIYDDLNVDNNVNPLFNGDYDINTHLLALTYTYTF